MRPKRQPVALAICGAVLLHAFVLLVFALFVAWKPSVASVPPPDDPVQLEVVQDEPPPTPPPVDLEPGAVPTPTPTPRRVVDAQGPDADSTPPADSALSDRATRASSAEESEDTRPGVTQAGKKMASFQFDPSPPKVGLIAPAQTAPPETAPALPRPDRTSARATPAPTAFPSASPPEALEEATPYPDVFAMTMATPPPLPEDPFDPSIRSTSPPLPKPATTKSTPAPPVGSTRSAMKGTSANRGPGGVDTIVTPSGRYAHQVTDMIKYIWGRSIERRGDMTYGTAVIHCTIDKDGLVLAPRIASNTADILFGSIALQAVAVARLPPMPPDVATELGGKLALDITFDLTPLPQEAALH